jgi:hypothetical protein
VMGAVTTTSPPCHRHVTPYLYRPVLLFLLSKGQRKSDGKRVTAVTAKAQNFHIKRRHKFQAKLGNRCHLSLLAYLCGKVCDSGDSTALSHTKGEA